MSFASSNQSAFASIKHPDILFPLDRFENFLRGLGWDPSEWIEFWLAHGGHKIAAEYLATGTKLDWIW